MNLPDDNSLKLILPGDSKGKPGQINVYKIFSDPSKQYEENMLEVTDGKQNYQFCCVSDCGRYAGFAQNDGRYYRVYDLQTEKMLCNVCRSNTSQACRSMHIVNDAQNPQVVYLVVATQSQTIHVFLAQSEQTEEA